MEEKEIIIEEIAQDQEAAALQPEDEDIIVTNAPDSKDKAPEDKVIVTTAGKAHTSYEMALRTMIFGALSIIAPLFALVFMVLQTFAPAFITGVVAIVFAVLAIVAAKKAGATVDERTMDMLKVGKLLGYIGIAISAAVLVWIVIQVIVLIISVISIVGLYTMLFLVAILGGGSGM